MTIQEIQDTLTRLVEKGFAKPDTQVNIGCGQKIYPIESIYKDDAPFANLNCVFIISSDKIEIKRLPLI